MHDEKHCFFKAFSNKKTAVLGLRLEVSVSLALAFSVSLFLILGYSFCFSFCSVLCFNFWFCFSIIKLLFDIRISSSILLLKKIELQFRVEFLVLDKIGKMRKADFLQNFASFVVVLEHVATVCVASEAELATAQSVVAFQNFDVRHKL